MGVLFSSLSGQVPDYYKQKTQAEAMVGRKLSNAEFERDYLVAGGFFIERYWNLHIRPLPLRA